MATLRERATALAEEIQGDYAKLDVLDEGYDQAHHQVTVLREQVAAATRGIARSQRQLRADKARLRTVAIDAYVNGASSSGIAMLLSSTSSELPMQEAYMKAASGNLNAATALVTDAAHQLAGKRSNLLRDEKKAAQAEQKIATERAMAVRITNSLESELSSVKGSLATAVAAAERQKALEQEAAAQAATLAHQQQLGTPAPAPSPTPSPSPPPVSGGGGATAVQAAESQLGVPYVWGGDTPGVGFDCSGLTMWSWEQAGVSLDHGATDQYYEIAHVSMSDLEPGDLIFYGDSSYLYHVVMYVGSGPYGSDTVIQAEQTGTNVMYTPIPSGAYGAGQP